MPPGIRGLFVAGILFSAFLPAAAPAAITITAPAISLPYSASAQTGTFEVWVGSTASPQPQVGAFGVEVQLPSFSSLTFVTSADTTPTEHTYIYSGRSTPTESIGNSGRTIFGGDFASSNPVPSLFDNAGLLLATYSVPAGASGFYPLTFVDYSNQNLLGTALFDQNNAQIPTTDQNGSIAIIPPTAYWHGTTNGVWTTDNFQTGVTNWTIDAAGTTDTRIAPGASTDVVFVASGATNLNTTLGADFSIKGLTFTSTATSPVTISGNTLTIGADGLTVQAGSAAHTINSAVTLGGSQTWHIANDSGAPLSIAGALSLPASATLTKADSGTLRITSAPSLGNNSSLEIDGGSVKFAVTTGSPTIGTGVTATISSAATLELAGSVSALSSTVAASQRVNIVNDSVAAGLLVSGTNQQVGAITGAGTTTVASGASLTANSIVQSALVIGGSQGNLARLTIAASDSSGNSLAAGGNLVSTSGLLSADSSAIVATGGDASQVDRQSGLSIGGADSTRSPAETGVPEPSSIALAVMIFGLGVFALKQKRGGR